MTSLRRKNDHSYFTYLRDLLTVARYLLTVSGSIFDQIGDENVHHARVVTPSRIQPPVSDPTACE